MKTKELAKLFKKYDEEYGEFEKIENKLSSRQDVHAFILLDKLCPADNGQDLICNSGHDEIWLGIEFEDLAKNITEKQVIELIRCGVRYSDDQLVMFV